MLGGGTSGFAVASADRSAITSITEFTILYTIMQPRATGIAYFTTATHTNMYSSVSIHHACAKHCSPSTTTVLCDMLLYTTRFSYIFGARGNANFMCGAAEA